MGYLARPHKGEDVCGDVGGWWSSPQRRVLALADGLGHGEYARHAAFAAMLCITEDPYRSVADQFAACDRRLFDSRGAALAIALIDRDSNVMQVAAIGNIRTLVLTAGREVRLGAGRGIVGAGYAWLPPDRITLAMGDTVVMFSDGIDGLAAVRSCVGAPPVTPQHLAEAVLAGWGRNCDDASVLVYRHDVIVANAS